MSVWTTWVCRGSSFTWCAENQAGFTPYKERLQSIRKVFGGVQVCLMSTVAFSENSPPSGKKKYVYDAVTSLILLFSLFSWLLKIFGTELSICWNEIPTIGWIRPIWFATHNEQISETYTGYVKCRKIYTTDPRWMSHYTVRERWDPSSARRHYHTAWMVSSKKCLADVFIQSYKGKCDNDRRVQGCSEKDSAVFGPVGTLAALCGPGFDIN